MDAHMKPLILTSLHFRSASHDYLFFPKTGTFMYCHPILGHLVDLWKAGRDVEKWCKAQGTGPVEIPVAAARHRTFTTTGGCSGNCSPAAL